MNKSIYQSLRSKFRVLKRTVKKSSDAFLTQSKGVLHVGANTGQERFLYDDYDLDILWVEPIPSVFEELEENLGKFPRQKALKSLVTNKVGEKYDFKIASNGGASSSILEFGDHKEIWPHVTYVESVELVSDTLEGLIQSGAIDHSLYDTLTIDTQGSELLVLEGLGKHIEAFKFVKVEAADFQAYQGCCEIGDLSDFLGKVGFSEISRHKFADLKGKGSYYDLVFKK